MIRLILILFPLQVFAQTITSFQVPTQSFLLRDVRAPITQKMIDIFSNFRQEISTTSIQFITTEDAVCLGDTVKAGKIIFTVDFNIGSDRIAIEYKSCNGSIIYSEIFEDFQEGFLKKKKINDILKGNIDLDKPSFKKYSLLLGRTTQFFSYTGDSYFFGKSEFLKLREEEKKSVFLIIPYREVISIEGSSWSSYLEGSIEKLEMKKESSEFRFFENEIEISALQFLSHLQEDLQKGENSPIYKTKEILKSGITYYFPETKVAENPAASQRFLNELLQLKRQVEQGQTTLVINKLNEFISGVVNSKIIIQDNRN